MSIWGRRISAPCSLFARDGIGFGRVGPGDLGLLKPRVASPRECQLADDDKARELCGPGWARRWKAWVPDGPPQDGPGTLRFAGTPQRRRSPPRAERPKGARKRRPGGPFKEVVVDVPFVSQAVADGRGRGRRGAAVGGAARGGGVHRGQII